MPKLGKVRIPEHPILAVDSEAVHDTLGEGSVLAFGHVLVLDRGRSGTQADAIRRGMEAFRIGKQSESDRRYAAKSDVLPSSPRHGAADAGDRPSQTNFTMLPPCGPPTKTRTTP